MHPLFHRRSVIAALCGCFLVATVSCQSNTNTGTSSGSNASLQASSNNLDGLEPLSIGAIPDQDPEKLQRLYSKLTDYLSVELGVPVTYEPVTDYAAAVTAFKLGDLDLVWFGGLTGVQARLQVPAAEAIAQRDIDENFHSIFIANTSSGITEVEETSDLSQLEGKTFTFGSETSTSGRLMPQYFLEQAGIEPSDFASEPGFSASHDATLKLVEAGTYQAGALNEQIWLDRVEAGEVDESRVEAIWQTPAYYDYHWVANRDKLDETYGEGFTEEIQTALLSLDKSDPDQAEILDLFGAEEFIATDNDNYAQIEEVGRKIGKIQ